MRVAIRTDASEAIGAGHFTRCLALADRVAASGGSVVFLANRAHPVIADALARRAHDLRLLNMPPGALAEVDAQASARALDPHTDWLVVDHYGLDHRWEAAVRKHVPQLLAIDDLADRRHACDVLVDPGYGRDATAYAGLVPPQADLLLGSRYALLKHTFVAQHDAAPRWPARRRVHVFFGSGDAAARWLARYCEWLLDGFAGVEVRAVGRGDRSRMEELALRFPNRLDWQEQVDDMAAHMATCDLAVGAPGSATWERACVGLPAALIATANNQVPILRELDRARFCRFLGSAWELDAACFAVGVAALLDDAPSLADMRARGVAAVDGSGVERIVRRLAAQAGHDD